MINLNDVLKTVDALTDEQKVIVIEHLRRSTEKQSDPTQTARIFNLHPGAMVMSEDFDDELPDSFWFGEE
jgi:3-phosphoglycerate kinase